MPDVSLSAGVDTSGVATGMASIENIVKEAGNSIASKLQGYLAIGALTAELHKIAGAAEEIHLQSARFGIDAEQLQVVTNAAKQLGLDIGQVARAMNLLEINAQKGVNPTTQQALALEHLGISAKAFVSLNADQKFLALADAYKNSAQDGQAYADVATLIGKRNTELIPLLAEGSKAIIDRGKAMRIMSNEEVDTLHALKVEEEKYLASLDGILAQAIVGWGRLFATIKKEAEAFSNWASRNGSIFSASSWKAGPFGVPVFVGNSGGGSVAAGVSPAPTTTPPVSTLVVPPPRAGAPVGITDIAGGGGIGGTGGGGSGSTAEWLQGLNAAQKINVLLKERETIQARLDSQEEQGDEHAATRYALEQQLEKVDQALLPLKQQLAIEEQSGVDAADRKIQKSQEEVEVLRAEAEGHTGLAELLKIEFSYEDKIKAALDRANEARAKGLELTAQENEELAAQLQAEQGAAIQAKQSGELRQAQIDTIKEGITLDQQRGSIDAQTAAYEQESVELQIKSQDLQVKIDDAYRSGNQILANQLEIQKGITDQLEEQARNAAFANQLRTQGIVVGQPGTDALGRLAAAGGSIGATSANYAAALAAARGLQPGSDAYNRLVQQIQAQDQLNILQGKNIDWRTQLERDKLVRWFADQQQQKSTQAAGISHQQEIDYWKAIAQGQAPPGSNPFNNIFGVPNLTTGKFNPPTGSTTTSTIDKLQSQLNVQQDSLTALQQIVKNTELVRV